MPRPRPTFSRLLIVLLALLTATLACSLSSGDEANPTPTRIPIVLTPTGAVTMTPTFVILTPTPLPTGAALPYTTSIPATQINCTPQTGWAVYTVAAGDTLGVIAAVTGSTVAQLASANCLTNTELIYVGQQLRVPQAPPVATAIPTSNPQLPIYSTALTVDPHWTDLNGRAITYSEAVRVNAGEVLNAATVAFYVNDPSGGPAIGIGSDTDPYDGAFVDYDFPAAGAYTFQAVAANEVGTLSSTTFTVTYDPAYQPPGGQRNLLTITPIISTAGGWYTLQGGATVTVTWPDGPVGALKVDFTFSPTSGSSAATVIGTDSAPADGSTITWAVPSATAGYLQARASMPDGSVQTSEIASVMSS
ncbi:LysM peptidoglycan-binding domain-containing protein [Aggregatilinea lenta]|uniref:LysM peptidoglycan-binding domain-containing protein n=1 Tax=Aggregatilinea lenta TaxID=913108 RepID=UPI001EE8249D|nr:LysM peptidoglycan-binding domain-containing protein [Aggregatilinea lenta]